MDFQKLCTFEAFQQIWTHYGYGGDLQDLIEQEFTRIKGKLMILIVFSHEWQASRGRRGTQVMNLSKGGHSTVYNYSVTSCESLID